MKSEIIKKLFLRNKDIAELLEISPASATNVMMVIRKAYPDHFSPLTSQIRRNDFLEYYGAKIEDFLEERYEQN